MNGFYFTELEKLKRFFVKNFEEINMKKRAVFCTLCLSLALTLAGCGSDGDLNEREFEPETDVSALKTEEKGTETSDGTETDISESLPEFKGIQELKGKTGSSAVNNKECRYQSFCYDDKAVYIANPRDNQYLYSYDGENLRLLADMPVYSLNYRDGMIYFLSNGLQLDPLDLIPVQGYLYSYDILNEKLTCLTDFMVSNLFVTDMGILYLYTDKESGGREAVYKLDEITGENIFMYENLSILDYHGYYIYYTVENGIAYYFISDGSKSYQLPIKGTPRYDCISDGKYYYRTQEKRSLNIIDLTNGERFEIEVPKGKSFLGLYGF